MGANDPGMRAREYSTSERLERRRQNVSGWLRGDEAWDEGLAAIALARPHRVIDAGCGDGLFPRAIAAPVVVGVDSAPAMVDPARSRSVDARLASIEELPFGDHESDVVVCNWVLCHLQEASTAVSKSSRASFGKAAGSSASTTATGTWRSSGRACVRRQTSLTTTTTS
jgi:SAM-dependent methyltransferase